MRLNHANLWSRQRSFNRSHLGSIGILQPAPAPVVIRARAGTFVMNLRLVWRRARTRREGRSGAGTVSYTHLDVYKRQVDPKTTALLMLDFVQPICGHTPRCIATLPAVKKLLDEARAHDMMVVYTGIPNVPESAVLPEVAPTGKEPYVQSFIDKFLNSDLEKILKDKGIKTVIAVGVSAVGAVLTLSLIHIL